MPKFIVHTFIERELEASNAEEAKQLFLEDLESESNLSLASTIYQITNAYPIVKSGSCGQEKELKAKRLTAKRTRLLADALYVNSRYAINSDDAEKIAASLAKKLKL